MYLLAESRKYSFSAILIGGKVKNTSLLMCMYWQKWKSGEYSFTALCVCGKVANTTFPLYVWTKKQQTKIFGMQVFLPFCQGKSCKWSFPSNIIKVKGKVVNMWISESHLNLSLLWEAKASPTKAWAHGNLNLERTLVRLVLNPGFKFV